MAVGDTFIFHGPSGVLTLRIERETECFDGLKLLVGTVLEGVEHDCEDDGTYHASRNVSGGLVGVYVTREDWVRGTNAPVVRPTNRSDRH